MNRYLVDLQRLLRHLDARLETQPDFADVRNLRALARAHAGDLPGARADLEAALGVNPDYHVARFNLAWVLARQDGPDAEGRATAIASPLPADWRRHLEVVRTAHVSGAAAALASVERLTGADAWWDLDRLWSCVESERWEAVREQLERIAGRDPELPGILRRTGLLQHGAPDREALARWAASYAGNPNGAALCRTGAELAHADGALEESRRLLAWSVLLSLDLCAYWIALGTQHESLGEEDAALAALGRAVEVDPGSAPARVALGYLFASRGRPAEAIGEFETAVQLAPRYADVRYQLGLLYSEVGRCADAETELRAAIGIQPGYVLARLALGCLLESLDRDVEALQLLQSVRQSGLRSADLETQLATLHTRLGHRNQARRAQARARASSRASHAGEPAGRRTR